LFAGVILFTAAGIAAPLFIVTVVVVFIPWLIWDCANHIERLHDRDKSAWWLLLFYGVPALLGQFAKAAWFAEAAGTALHYILALAGFALTIWGFVEIGCLRGTTGPNNNGSNPMHAERRESATRDAQATIARGTQKTKKARWPSGHRAKSGVSGI
jgi:uncharacterized membrane protein YhaH (DUF805 family)